MPTNNTPPIQPFTFKFPNRGMQSLSLEAVIEYLKGIGIQARIEARSKSKAISFTKLPCPACGKTSVKAYAFPPAYALKCFNAQCKAYYLGEGVPFSEWAGIPAGVAGMAVFGTNPTPSATLPQTLSITDARKLIEQELATSDDVLLNITPGVGKTYTAVEYLAKNYIDKTVIYSTYNKATQREAYDRCKGAASDPNKVHLILSRNELCTRASDLKRATDAGFSPSLTVCSDCVSRPTCQYFAQRISGQAGIYFVTHHSLRYIRDTIPSPSLIILDENLLMGFKQQDECGEADMKTIYKVRLQKQFTDLLDLILQLSAAFSTQVMKNGDKYDQMLNGRKLLGSNTPEDLVIELLASSMNISVDDVVDLLKKMHTSLKANSQKDILKLKVSFKAINWIEALFRKDRFPYIVAGAAGTVSFSCKYFFPLNYENVPVKVLDATGHVGLAESLLKRPVREVKVEVTYPSNNAHAKRHVSRISLGNADEKVLKKILKEAIVKITAQKVLVITYLNYAEKVLRLCRAGDPSKTFRLHHFQGPRGINDYADCDAVLVLGLPYPNLNDCFHDACILFPDKKDEATRIEWVNLTMNWELEQCIHRIRPVLKSTAEIVIIAGQWPKFLKKPAITTSTNYKGNWKEDAIFRITPFVKVLGFFNQDIAAIAGVRIKKKAKSADEFRDKYAHVAPTVLERLIKNGKLVILESDLAEPVSCLEMNSIVERVISCINTTTCTSYPLVNEELTESIFHSSNEDVLKQLSQNLSNTNQFADLITHFKTVFPHFNEFLIKLPHAGGNNAKTVGSGSQIKRFYDSMADSKLFKKKVNTTNLKPIATGTSTLLPIPTDYAVVVFDEANTHIAHIRFGDDVETLPDALIPHWLQSNPNLRIGTLITSNGLRLAKILLDHGIGTLEIHDVVLNQRILKNAHGVKDEFSIDELFMEYGLPDLYDLMLCGSSIYQVWQQQQQELKANNLDWIAEIERQVIWVVASMVNRGILVDKNGIEDLSVSDPMAKRILTRVKADAIYHDEIDSLGTIDGRLLSKLHGVPKKGALRPFFQAQPGYTFIIADYKEQHPRILSAMSNDSNSQAIFNNGVDFYSEVVRVINAGIGKGINIDRNGAKKLVNGLKNLQQPPSLHKALVKMFPQIQLSEVNAFVASYSSHFSGFSQFQNTTIQTTKTNGYATTQLGRRLKIGASTRDASIISFVIQGTASDGFKLALAELHAALKGKDAHILHTMHDGVIVEASEDEADNVAEIAKIVMEQAFQNMFPNMPFPVSLVVQDTWGLPVPTQTPPQKVNLTGTCVDCTYFEEKEGDRGMNIHYCGWNDAFLDSIPTKCDHFHE